MKKVSIALIVLLILAIALVSGLMFFKKPFKRYAVFAGFNDGGVIKPYVISYLKGLNEVSDGVVYITDSELNEGEEQKLKGLVLYSEHKRHNEYDWGSYKRGFNWLKDNGYLNEAQELIFSNDSCYAPLSSFKPMFETMAKRTALDFWGNSQNVKFNPHLQSYFLVFKAKVFNSKSFSFFMNSITHQEDQSLYITEYEVKLTPYLENLGFKWGSFISSLDFPFGEETDINSYPLTAIRRFHNNFLKRRTFTKNLRILEDIPLLLVYLKKEYPLVYEMIKEDFPHFFVTDEDRGEHEAQ